MISLLDGRRRQECPIIAVVPSAGILGQGLRLECPITASAWPGSFFIELYPFALGPPPPLQPPDMVVVVDVSSAFSDAESPIAVLFWPSRGALAYHRRGDWIFACRPMRRLRCYLHRFASQEFQVVVAENMRLSYQCRQRDDKYSQTGWAGQHVSESHAHV